MGCGNEKERRLTTEEFLSFMDNIGELKNYHKNAETNREAAFGESYAEAIGGIKSKEQEQAQNSNQGEINALVKQHCVWKDVTNDSNTSKETFGVGEKVNMNNTVGKRVDRGSDELENDANSLSECSIEEHY